MKALVSSLSRIVMPSLSSKDPVFCHISCLEFCTRTRENTQTQVLSHLNPNYYIFHMTGSAAGETAELGGVEDNTAAVEALKATKTVAEKVSENLKDEEDKDDEKDEEDKDDGEKKQD